MKKSTPFRAKNFIAQAEAAKAMTEAIQMTTCILCGGPYVLKEDAGCFKIYECTKCKIEATVS